MAHLHLIDPNLRCIFVRYWGLVDIQELDQAREDIERDADFAPGLNRIWDERDCTIEVSHQELEQLSRAWSASNVAHGPRKLAYLVKQDVSWGFNRVFEAYRDNPEVSYQLFRDYEAAKVWLGLPATTPDPRELLPTPAS